MSMPYQPPTVNDYEPVPTSPLSDPFHAGLLPSATGALLSPGRSHHGPGDLPDVGGVHAPDVDVSGQLGEVLGSSGGESGSSESGAGEKAPARQPIQSDADAPAQGIHDLGNGRLTHIRNGVATDLGPA